MMLFRPRAALALALFLPLVACAREPASRPPAYTGYPAYGSPGAPPPGYAGQPAYGYGPPPSAPPPYYGPPPVATTPPATPTSPAPALPPSQPAPAGYDPINQVDIGWLRNEAGSVIGELIAALPPAARAKVENIPFVADPTVGEVNAFAACDDQGLPLMAITDGLLEVEAHMAQYKAIDELFGTQKLVAYEQLVAQNTRPHQPIVRPGPGFTDPSQDLDPRKLARQRDLLDEQLAFVLGHELSHHHLGHTGCANGQGVSRGVSPADLGRLLSRVVPLFNQPNEIAADVSGVQNLLTAGARRQGYRWTEGGAVLTLQFFAALDRLTPASVVFAFENTHPLPQVRLPIVQSTANAWRATGGGGLQLPGLGGLFGG